MVQFSVPLHQLVVNHVQEEVTVGVHPQLLDDGLRMVFGHHLAGDKVWADCQSNVVKSPKFPISAEAPMAPLPAGDIFPACSVTCAASRD